MNRKSLPFVLFLFVSLSINLPLYSENLEVKIDAVENPDNFHFVVMGDRTGGEQKGVFEQMISKVNLMCPAFVVNVGDNIAGYTTDPNNVNNQWDEFDSLVKKLNVPYLKVSGNHDITNEMMADIYQKRFGKTYYYSIYKNVLFLFLNSDDPSASIDQKLKKELEEEKKKLKEMAKTQGVTPAGLMMLKEYEEKNREMHGGTIADAQFEFASKVLADHNNVRWTFVIMHKPLWKLSSPPANWTKIENILKDRPYTVFAGHEHINSYSQNNSRDYIVTATCGGSQGPASIPGIYHHIYWITMDSTGPTIANLLADGILEKTDIRPKNGSDTIDVKKIVEEFSK
ncbi:MAG: hypothetical protein A2Y10_05145 [Planctomycetes bacterium GWF2_41_51]|nr:MAG: hypothetical protein A2Y10_05145 [Planctomycetes bacterium GWF2_41_51]HBG25549.1 hypothetical protein [Phycisphaerales bacterium]